MRFTKDCIIGNRYKIESFIGSGAFGEVFKANSRHFGTVAIKVFSLDDSTTSRVEMILKEASMLAELEHPNVVRIYETGHHDSKDELFGYIVMEYMPGGTLQEFLEKNIRLPADQACNIGCNILSALSCAHSFTPPIIHGDVKPENVLLFNDSPLTVKVGDFGLAKEVCPVTGMTAAAGTLFYLAPESLWGYALPGSDVFSAGLVIYLMLTGTGPFALPELDHNNTHKEVRRAIEKSRQAIPLPPSRFNPDIDPELDEVILRSLALDHRERYPNAGEFLNALSEYMRHKQPAKSSDRQVMDHSITNIPLFGLQDYRDLACSGGMSQDDINALWELYCDLESPISVDQQGVFSVTTLTGLTKTELMSLNGKSISQWLYDPDTPISELRIIKDIGKLLYSNPYSNRAVRSGLILYIASISAAWQKYGEWITRMNLEQLKEISDDLLYRPYLPPKYRLLISQARASLY